MKISWTNAAGSPRSKRPSYAPGMTSHDILDMSCERLAHVTLEPNHATKRARQLEFLDVDQGRCIVGGARKSDRRDMPDVFVMKLDRATSEESGTPRLKCYDTMRRDRSSDAEALDELSWVSLLSLLPWSWLLSSICVRCVEKRAGWPSGRPRSEVGCLAISEGECLPCGGSILSTDDDCLRCDVHRA